MSTTRVSPIAVTRPRPGAACALRRAALPVVFAGVILAATTAAHAQQRARTPDATVDAPGGRPGAPAGRQSGARRRSAQADRWSRLPPQKRKQLKAIYDQLKTLPPEKRRLLLDRLRELDSNARRERIRTAKRRLESGEDWLDRQSRQTRRALLESLPRDVRERLRGLPARERQQHLQKLVAERRARLIETLPPDAAREVRNLPPGRQAQRLKQHRTAQLLRRTFRDADEIDALRRLPRRELRRLLAPEATERGSAAKPEYLSPRTWARWTELKPYERERILRMVRAAGELRSGGPPLDRGKDDRGRVRQERRARNGPEQEAGTGGTRPDARRRSAQRDPRRRPPRER